MNWVTAIIAFVGINFIFLIIIFCGYLIIKEHNKIQEKRNLELKNIKWK